MASIKNDGEEVSSFGKQTEVMKALAADVSSAWNSVNVALYAYDSLDASRLEAPGYAPRVRAAFRLGRQANLQVDGALGKVKVADLSDQTIGRFKALDCRELLNFKDDLSARQALLVAELSHDPTAIAEAHKNFTQQLTSSARTEFEVSVAQGHLSADLASEEAENKTALAAVGHRVERFLVAFLIWIACVIFAACYLVAIRVGLVRSAREVFRTW